MKKDEFMDLLNYYFRKADKSDLKGILEDCEEQFRRGAAEGKSEEEICYKLGHPKNIYRYYIGKPIVPEENESLAGPNPGDFDHYSNFGPGLEDAGPYDWDQEPAQPPPRRPQRPQRPAPRQEDMETGGDFDWGSDGETISTASKAVASPFLDILGSLFGILSGFIYLALALSIIASIAISFIPSYFYTDLLPLPTLSLQTRIFTVLAILFGALTLTYASVACHSAARGARHSKRRS